eukprot:28513_1
MEPSLVYMFILVLIRTLYSDNTTIYTTLGEVTGIQQDNYTEFRRIPYTENAPVGDYRFTESVVRTAFYTDDQYDATYFGSACVQADGFISVGPLDEDCLFLNILAPDIYVNGSAPYDPLPVMVWIHGGAFISGVGSYYPGTAFVKSENVIYVSINYRLSAFGFVALESVYNETNGKTTGGMNGINDIIVALEWIQQYISEFGGDPAAVTIFGESAGGFAICYLSILSAAANLFDRVIIQSGHCSPAWAGQRSREEAISDTLEQLATVGLADDLVALRAVNASVFVDLFVLPWPSVDGYYLETTAHQMIADGAYSLNADQIIIGSNSLDSLVLFPYFFSLSFLTAKVPESDEEFEGFVNQYIAEQSDRDLLKTMYYPIGDFASFEYADAVFSAQAMRWDVMNGDVCFKCPELWYIDQIIANGAISEDDVYLYNLVGVSDPFLVPHSGDLPFLFDSFTFDFFGINGSEDLANLMSDSWTSFAVNGVPNSSLITEQWQPYGVNKSAMVFGKTSSNLGHNVDHFGDRNYRNGVCDFWNYKIGIEVVSAMCAEVYTLSPTRVPTTSPTDQPTTVILATGSTLSESDDNANTIKVNIALVFVVFVIFFTSFT